jgi:8-oxo-dGTP diphosphatase
MMKVAVDAVVFTVMKNKLHVLLITRKYTPFKGKCAIPGGFVKRDENLEVAAKRELTEETGVNNIYLKQIGAYGDVGRDPRGRVVSIAFLALISPDHDLKATSDALEAKWFPIDRMPELAFDHKEIIAHALQDLRFEIQTTNLAYQILPKKFTLSQLQALYESILDKDLDKRNFRRRILEMGVLKETSESFMEGAHRPAKLFVFREQKYAPLKERLQVFV